ncbi:MAG: DHH family phosphoesterase [Bacillota bacterium]|nr:DHH family phosphoesterase [Bacillota bacterium]
MVNNRDHVIVYIIVIGIFCFVLTFYNIWAAVLGFLTLIALSGYNLFIEKRQNSIFRDMIRTISLRTDTAAKHTVSNFPIPVVVIEQDGTVKWFNPRFSDLFDEEELYDRPIRDVIPTLNLDHLATGFTQSDIAVGSRLFHIVSSKVDESDDTVLYLLDDTEHAQLLARYQAEQSVVALVHVDNLDDVIADTREDKVPFVTSDIEKRILGWGARMHALIKKYAGDKYIVVMTAQDLQRLENDKFRILDEVREIDSGNRIPITLSIGIGQNGETLASLEEEAFACLELALGRGGDQAVVKKNSNFEFYGGKSKAVERRNRVKARVIAHGFRSLVDESSRVLIMGHRIPDMDSFGASVGVYRAARMRGAEAHIVLAEPSDAIEAVYHTIMGIDEYSFIPGERAMEMVDERTLLVVVDTHKPSLTEYPPLVEACDRVVLIDHHRRSTEFIDKAVIKYLEPYASSASELVTEMLQYMTNRPEILKEEADALLAGITVDTKHFTLKTGVRTFDAAAFLRKQGADSIKVRQLFQDDIEIFIEKAAIVSTAQKYHENIAISTAASDSEHIQLIVAQAADDLLDIKGIAASFVIARRPDGVTFISGRSLGEVNVQVILELIGGGGHLEVAGAQFADKSVEEAKELLIGAIEQYYKEGENE